MLGRRLPLMLLPCVVLLGACSRTPPSPPHPTALAPAGTVEQVEGQVAAQRAQPHAPVRPLAVRAPVWPDDTVTTAAGASVAIRLQHNGVRWELQGGQQRRVDQTAAWRASRVTASPLLADEAALAKTAAAGRHSEQEAAQAAETATRPLPPSAVTPPQLAQPAVKPSAQHRHPHGETAKPSQAHAENGGSLDDMLKQRAPHGEVSPGAEVQGAVSRETVQQFLAPLRPRFAKCYQQTLPAHPNAQGRVVLQIRFGQDGRIAEVHATSETLPPEVGQCLEALLKKQPRTPMRGLSVSVPLVFQSAQ